MRSSLLFSFAYFPYYNDSVELLAEKLASKEKWDFSNTHKKEHKILKNYLEFTFRKLKQENKVAYTPDKEFACFNTGLVTENFEDIYAFFEKYEYKNPKPKNAAPFYFKSFLKKSDNNILRNFSGNLPDVANFFEKPELLIFNSKCELIPDIDHIIKDNIERFPVHLKGADEGELRRQLVGAIDETKKKVRTNYMIAVPQYYNGNIQLLLPLCLTVNSPNPDLALVAYKIDGNTYTARTCLTLKWHTIMPG